MYKQTLNNIVVFLLGAVPTYFISSFLVGVEPNIGMIVSIIISALVCWTVWSNKPLVYGISMGGFGLIGLIAVWLIGPLSKR